VIHDPLPPDAWAAEGRRIAPHLNDVAAAIITGRDANAAAAVALAIAEAHAHERRVAIADLVGGVEPFSAAGDLPGLLECLRDGTELSEIARPLRADGSIFVLPSGRGAIAERWVFESARWERLIGGFREVDALLLLLTPPSAPGLETLIGRVDGVIPVDLPPTLVRTWPLLATVDRPEQELPEIVASPPRGIPQVARSRRWPAVAAALALVSVAGVAGWVATRGEIGGTMAAVADSASAPAVASAEEPAPVHIALGPLVNPDDSSRAAAFSVEVVAANTLASANSRLVFRTGMVPAATVAPVILGAGATWYRAMAGAWNSRDDAEAWLDAARARGELGSTGGRVMHAPVALLLAESRTASEIEAQREVWVARGIAAYALRDENGMMRLYAGAFEFPAQAAVLAMTLRDNSVEPRVAYRIGRMF
jgi:hypothetical protein